MSRLRPTASVTDVKSSLPSEGSIGACHHEATLQAAGKVVHLGDGPTIPLRVRLGILLARGGILLHARRLGSRMIHRDNHKFLHLSNLPQIRPAANFTMGGDSPPLIRHLGYQSSFRLMMSANPLWFSYYRTKGEGDMRTVALPHRRCHLTTS